MYFTFKKFTPKEEIDRITGGPKFQIQDRPLFYYGNGIFIAYTSRCFKVSGCERIEFGEEGLYAVSIYHFLDVEFIEEYFNLDTFEADDINECVRDTLELESTYKRTYRDIQKLELGKKYINYREGESRALMNGIWQIKYLFITCNGYTLFFRGTSKNNKLSGYQYVLGE